MHYFIFLHINNNFLKYNMINNAVCIKLSLIKISLNKNFIKLISNFIIHNFCDFNYFNAFYIIKKIDNIDLYYIKEFFKLFYINTVINENKYSKCKQH